MRSRLKPNEVSWRTRWTYQRLKHLSTGITSKSVCSLRINHVADSKKTAFRDFSALHMMLDGKDFFAVGVGVSERPVLDTVPVPWRVIETVNA